MHNAQSHTLLLGHSPRKILKIRGWKNLQIRTVMFISRDYVIIPTLLNIKQVKS